MLDGPSVLTDADLDVVAAWAYKTSLLAELADPMRGEFPDWVFREFRTTGEPPADVSIVLGMYFGDEHQATFFADYTVDDAVTGPLLLPGFARTLVLPPVLPQVLQADGITDTTVRLHHNIIRPNVRKALICAWPPASRRGSGFPDASLWPPSMGWGDEATNRLMEILRGRLGGFHDR